ncbi:DEAD/DEAH box helicase [Christiangramia sabulilitoris]|uniref:DEAD/DEAH box helicase n=1 Tax=Christiangramia sabulilitoris TaxID=2583991 RepID=A0A550I7T1_9FLAO|nr:DEAD/DEAH box helicase [Christiangramia sabulilitoris]TRO67033.1 DEAD/DEAH box helicase [Christiangramia sabulilitoris]
MSFKKLNIPLKEAIDRKGFEAPTAFQKKVLPKIKSGADLYILAPEGSGKTTAMIISVIQKLNSEAFEDSPRALIYVKDKASALELEQKFQEFTREMYLRIYCAYDEQNIDDQKDEIYYGVDIVIATPRRLGKLFSMTGIHLGQLQMFILEDAEFLSKGGAYNDVVRIPLSINKCQYLVFAQKMEPKMERLQDLFMERAQIVKASK